MVPTSRKHPNYRSCRAKALQRGKTALLQFQNNWGQNKLAWLLNPGNHHEIGRNLCKSEILYTFADEVFRLGNSLWIPIAQIIWMPDRMLGMLMRVCWPIDGIRINWPWAISYKQPEPQDSVSRALTNAQCFFSQCHWSFHFWSLAIAFLIIVILCLPS